MYQKAQEIRKKQEIEDIKNQAYDMAQNKIMQGGEFNKIIEDIEKAENNVKMDNFAIKYALIVCNADYKTKSGL